MSGSRLLPHTKAYGRVCRRTARSCRCGRFPLIDIALASVRFAHPLIAIRRSALGPRPRSRRPMRIRPRCPVRSSASGTSGSTSSRSAQLCQTEQSARATPARPPGGWDEWCEVVAAGEQRFDTPVEGQATHGPGQQAKCLEHPSDVVRRTRRGADKLRPGAKQGARSMGFERHHVHRSIPSRAHNLREVPPHRSDRSCSFAS